MQFFDITETVMSLLLVHGHNILLLAFVPLLFAGNRSYPSYTLVTTYACAYQQVTTYINIYTRETVTQEHVPCYCHHYTIKVYVIRNNINYFLLINLFLYLSVLPNPLTFLPFY